MRHNCGHGAEEDRRTGMMTNCQLLQCVTSHKDVEMPKKIKPSQNIVVIVSTFPF